MKGLFIPEITTEMFRNGCLESIEALMAEGKIYDIDYQQPCEDCISREAVMSVIFDLWEPTEYNDEDDFLECLENSINRLLSVKPETKWIPCTERLPQNGQKVLITTKNGSVMDFYYIEGNSTWDMVTAWTPAPEPYKGGGEEE